MQSNDQPPIVPLFFTGEFKRNLRQLAKKYRRIKSDIQPILDQLAAGQILGDRIPGVSFEVYKVRVRNSDSARGTSGGYRIIYQRTPTITIILFTIYSKTEQSDITPRLIQDLIKEFEREQADLESPEIASDEDPSRD